MIEVLFVLAILGIFLGMFYTTWIMNWSSFEEHTLRSDLWQDANKILETMSLDGRAAAQIDVQDLNKTAVFRDTTGAIFMTYRITNNGEMQRQQNGAAVVEKLSAFVNFNNSLFEKKGKALQTKLVLSDSVFGRPVDVLASTEIYPRN